ncbi:MAG: hypothetical protein COB96_05620 [Planctomycetota bacterium]|nr:MAG: hypothetical protein COB96_05620 [Planctomycetota bacterium]
MKLFSCLCAFLLTSQLGLAQQRGAKPPVIRVDPPTPEQSLPTIPAPIPNAQPGITGLGQVAPGDAFGALLEQNRIADDPRSPRPLSPDQPPFTTERVLLTVDGEEITAGDINQLVSYYRSFRPGATDILIRDAVAALIPGRVARARFAVSLVSMDVRIKAAAAQADLGPEDWLKLVERFSDDKEEDSPADGAYVFGREQAVQPFDLLAHTFPKGKLSKPFLTVYGFHVLEVTDYERAERSRDDQSFVRHLLVMYPQLKEWEAAGKDIRAEIKQMVAECKIQIAEAWLRNMVPPKLRSNLVVDRFQSEQ